MQESKLKKILEDKSQELYLLSEELKTTNAKLKDLLNEKASLLQGVFKNINDAYIEMDLEGNVLMMNKAAVKLFGYDISIECFNVVDLLCPDDKKYAYESFDELKETGSFSNFITRIRSKDEKIIWVQINGSLLYDKYNNPISAQGIVRDITEEKEALELIDTQKKELDLIFEESPLGIVLTREGNILKTNKSFQKLLGYTEEEFSLMSIRDVSYVVDYPESKKQIEMMVSGELDGFVVQKRYKRKDDSFLWAKTNANAVRNSDGVMKFQVAFIEDVTQERERTLVVDMINDVAKTILGKIDIYEIALVIINKIAAYLKAKNSVIYFVNHQDNSLEEIAINEEMIHEEKQEFNKIIVPISEGIVGTVAKTGEAEIIKDTTKDQRYMAFGGNNSLSKIAVPIVNEGEVIAIIASESNEKNYYTKEHKKTLKNIANLVALQLKSAFNLIEREKTELKNTELLCELEKSNEELQEYAHIVSHDLKSPLRSISALTSWIKTDNKEKFDTETLQNFNLIETTLETMESLISNILEYSSINSSTDENQEVDLNIVVEELKYVVHIPDTMSINVLRELPVVKGDRTKFQQLFQNLVSNAVKFNDKEKGIINIDVEKYQSFYKFSIQDNGIGIEEKHFNKIFKIFQSLKVSIESSGIGLSIVKKIIDFYHGEIWVESELKLGTTFYFTIKK